MESGRVVAAAPYGMDRTDYQWALSLPKSDVTSVENHREARAQPLRDLKSDPYSGSRSAGPSCWSPSIDTGRLYGDPELVS